MGSNESFIETAVAKGFTLKIIILEDRLFFQFLLIEEENAFSKSLGPFQLQNLLYRQHCQLVSSSIS